MIKSPIYRWWVIGGLSIIALGGWLIWRSQPKPAPYVGDSAYQSLARDKTVSQIAEGLGPVTRVKLTPDEGLMFVANLKGELRVLAQQANQYVLQDEPVYRIATGFLDGEENGMTGLIVSKNFADDHSVFLTYAQRVGAVGRQRIMRLTVIQDETGQYIGTDPKVVFTGNTNGSGAHQIQGGESLIIDGKLHLLFAIGELYHPEYAQDLKREAGKIMLIQADGTDPVGERPFSGYPRIQAIGIRNAYDLSIDGETGWAYISQNGPDRNDTILRAPLLVGGHKIDFNWHDNADDLLRPLDNNQPHPEYIVKHWAVTLAPTDILAAEDGKFYFNIFSSNRVPQKELVMGKIKAEGEAELRVVANRRVDGGNLLGLAISRAGSLYFGDFLDGTIYRWSKP